MTHEQKIVEDIRNELGGKPKTLIGYRNALEIIAEQLYKEKEHFIFELIQNADDNTYDKSVSPSLSFTLKELFFDNKNQICLIVENNEVGFREENVRAICSVKESTKIGRKNCTGEKGIGFKSVFAATDCPYIFSNKYCFCLPPDMEVEGGVLPYIVPRWVEENPSYIKANTTIILPLKEDCVQRITHELKEFRPETILFLRKLQQIRIVIDLTGYHCEQEIERREASHSRIVTLRHKITNEQSENIEERAYLYWSKTIDKPNDLIEETRAGIDEITLTIAVPLVSLDDDKSGSLYAYLPVHNGTGFPFIINSDFVLTANRSQVVENDWNTWIRSEIPQVFSDAIKHGMNSDKLSYQQKVNLFSRIPEDSNYDFLATNDNQCIEEIYHLLSSCKCVLTFQSDIVSCPNECKQTPSHSNMLRKLNWSPNYMGKAKTEYLFIAEELKPFEGICTRLGVNRTTAPFISCISTSFLSHCSNEQLIELYSYLMERQIAINNTPLIPVDDEKNRSFVSGTNTALFWKKNPNKKLPRFEKYLRVRYVAEGFRKSLQKSFDHQTENLEKEAKENSKKELKEQFEQFFSISDVSLKNYCRRLNETLNSSFEGSEKDFVSISHFLLEHNVYPDYYYTNQGIICLDDLGEIDRTWDWGWGWNEKEKKLSYIVVSEDYDVEYGWQNIWRNEDARSHFAYLIGYKKQYQDKLLNAELNKKIDNRRFYKYPLFDVKIGYQWTEGTPKSFCEKISYLSSRRINNCHTVYAPIETEIIKTNQSIESFLHYLSYWTTCLENGTVEDFDNLSLVERGLLRKEHIYQSSKNIQNIFVPSLIVEHLQRTQSIPSDKGLSQPHTLWMPSKEIKELFGDTVSYIRVPLTKNIASAIGIHTELSADALFSFIRVKANAKESIPQKNAERLYLRFREIYRSYAERDRINDFFENNNAIYIPNTEKLWYKKRDCIISKGEFDERDFQCISEVYSDYDILDFFRNSIKVSETIPVDYYLVLWQKYQEENIVVPVDKVNVFYNAIYGIYNKRFFSTQEKWDELKKKIKPLAEDGQFVDKEDVFLVDSPELEDCYKDYKGVFFVPFFNNLSLSELETFYKELGVRRLSDSIEVTLLDDCSNIKRYKDITSLYLTPSCVAMIAAWIQQNILYYRDDSNNSLRRLKSSKMIDFPHTPHVSCLLDRKYRVDLTKCVYFDVSKNVFLCYLGNIEDFKIELSVAIAQFILGNSNKSKVDGFASEIEHYLQSSNTKRVDRKGWIIPDAYKEALKPIPAESNHEDTIPESPVFPKHEDNSSIQSYSDSEKKKADYTIQQNSLPDSTPDNDHKAVVHSATAVQSSTIPSTDANRGESPIPAKSQDVPNPPVGKNERERNTTLHTSEPNFNDGSKEDDTPLDGELDFDAELEMNDDVIQNNDITPPKRPRVSRHTVSVMRNIAQQIQQDNTSDDLFDFTVEDYDQDDYTPRPIDYQKRIKDEVQKSAFSIRQIEHMEELQKKASESAKYSFAWFKSLLEMECFNSSKSNTKSREISIEFSKVEREMGSHRILVLKQPNRYIPQFMEDIADIPLVLHMGDTIKKVEIEVSNIKSYTLRVKLKNPADIQDVDLSMVKSASIDAQSPDFLLKELLRSFNALNLSDDDNLQEKLCENIEFIFGPPGTGKTTYLAREVLLPLMNDSENKKVLVLTPTNKAADVLVRRIMETDDSANNHSCENWLIRFGTTGDETIENSPVFKDKTFDIRQFPKNVTVTTIARFPYDFFMVDGKRLHLQSLNWDYIVIDEASMIPLVDIIYPLYKKTPQKFIIAGDPFQIQPISTVDIWKDENIYSLVGLNSFKNPCTRPHQYAIKNLSTQYRSIPEIGNVFSQFAYDGILKHNRTSESRTPLNFGDELIIKPINILKYPVSRYESIYRAKRLQHRSAYQIYSALFTCEFVLYLSSLISKNNPGTLIKIGVIAPYRAQADLLEKLVASQKMPKEVSVQVGTIHGFQGDECDIIFAVFNAPPTISRSTEMFLNKRNIINVSISRARDYLFIVMPDDETENINNLFCVKHVEQIIKQNQSWTESLTPDLELRMFGDSMYLENNAFSTSHQNVNVYGNPEKTYEVRTEDNAVDIQIHNSNL